MERYSPSPKRKKNYQPSTLYPEKPSLINEGEMKMFQDKQKLKESVTIQTALQMILKGILPTEAQKDNQHSERIRRQNTSQ